MVRTDVFLVVLFLMFAGSVAALAFAWARLSPKTPATKPARRPLEPRNEWDFVSAIYSKVKEKQTGWGRHEVADWFEMHGVPFGAHGYGWSLRDAESMAGQFLEDASTW